MACCRDLGGRRLRNGAADLADGGNRHPLISRVMVPGMLPPIHRARRRPEKS
jgi:hypothetical protein